jgi:hypothetical protein
MQVKCKTHKQLIIRSEMDDQCWREKRGLRAQVATPIESYGDLVKLAWVISNLLKNAVP